MSERETPNKIQVLDKGYVLLKDVMGSDLTTVNAARVSYMKESHELTPKDIRLIKFLADHDHTSPFRHATLQFEVYAPLMVARQWWRYIVGSMHQDPMGAWNESSRRYVTEEVEFYLPSPDEWRLAPENKKQGSGGKVPAEIGALITATLASVHENCKTCYDRFLEAGIAPEMARLFLPAYGLYVRWVWTCSLQALAHFLCQRLAHDAQKEIQEYAKAVFRLSKGIFEVSLRELLRSGPPELNKLDEVREFLEEKQP